MNSKDFLDGCLNISLEIWLDNNKNILDSDDVLFAIKEIPNTESYPGGYIITVEYQKDRNRFEPGPIQETPISLPKKYQFIYSNQDNLIRIYENIEEILNNIV